jgi:S1-C subfamily serine protease
MTKEVKLSKLNTYILNDLGLSVKNTSQDQRDQRKVEHGVFVTKVNNAELFNLGLDGAIITKVNDVLIYTIDDLKNAAEGYANGPLKLTFYDRNGEKSSIVFR